MNKRIIPLLCTRGAIVFPNQDLTVEVGRMASINAVEYANRENLPLFVVSQKTIDVEQPGEDDIFNYGTLSTIKNFRRKEENHLRVVFQGERVGRILRHFSENDVNFVFSNA